MNHKTESNAYLYCSIGFSGKTVVDLMVKNWNQLLPLFICHSYECANISYVVLMRMTFITSTSIPATVSAFG
jgi:hypothetical protein